MKPRVLKVGDTIGVVAPSSPSKLGESEIVGKLLKEFGFKAKLGKSCFSSYGYLAGSDEIRANDINNMFLDTEVDGIICLRGGYGTPRILDKLDYDLISKNPKVFVGYSDITAIHIALNNKCDLVTFHGPMVASDIAKQFDDFSKLSFLKAITTTEPMGELYNPEGEQIECLEGGIAEGKIVGGNLSLIAATIGTPYEINTKGKLLFIEDIDERPYRVDRMLTQLRLAGKLEQCSGIILGDFNNCIPNECEDSLTLMEVFMDIIKPLGKPTIYNFKAGHCEPKITVPFGVDAILDANEGQLIIKESACSAGSV